MPLLSAAGACIAMAWHGMAMHEPCQARRNGKVVRALVCPLRKAAKHAASLLEPPCKLAFNDAHA